jgi:hypothetical protein
MRECRAYWKTRNDEREVTLSRDERDKPRALANAEAGVRQLYGREMDVAEADRGIFAVPLERRLKTTSKTMQQWVTATKEMVNLMVSRREKREAERQPDIRTAVIAVVTVEMEIAYRARQERRRETAQPPAKPTRRKNTAATTAQLRAARPKVCMIDKLMRGNKDMEKKRKNEKRKKEEEKEEAAKAKTAKKKAKASKFKSNKAREARQHAPHPNTIIQIDRIRMGRLPNFKVYVEEVEEPILAPQQPHPQEKTSPAKGSEALNKHG